VSLLVMCMSYQASSGIYLLIVVILGFQNWNSRKKTNKEILSFLGIATFAFSFAILIFKFFLMRPAVYYVSTAMQPLPHLISGSLNNIKDYAMIINKDFGLIWKIAALFVCILFITTSIYRSSQKKPFSLFVSILVVGISFILSYGVYIFLEIPLFEPRALYGFGVLLAILCIYIVSDYKKVAIISVLALNWCFLIFAFSYGNALADQARYAEFRIGILLHDLSSIYSIQNEKDIPIQLKNSIDYAPSIKNISKHYPIIERLVPKRLAEVSFWDNYYYLEHFHYSHFYLANIPLNAPIDKYIDFNSLNLPVVLDSYYHTIQSDGTRILVVLKH